MFEKMVYRLPSTKRPNASKLEQADYVFVLQPKADHQGSKILFTDFRGIGLFNIEKVIRINICLVRKNSTNKTRMLHRKPLRQMRPKQPLPDVQITPQEWKPDPEVTTKHDDLYARAWECDYEGSIYDARYDKGRRHPIHPKMQGDLIYQPKKCGTDQEPHECVPPKFYLQKMDCVAEGLRIPIQNTMRKRA